MFTIYSNNFVFLSHLPPKIVSKMRKNKTEPSPIPGLQFLLFGFSSNICFLSFMSLMYNLAAFNCLCMSLKKLLYSTLFFSVLRASQIKIFSWLLVCLFLNFNGHDVSGNCLEKFALNSGCIFDWI